MPTRIGKAALYLFLSYWIVTAVVIALTLVFDALFHPPTPQELGVSASQAPAYLMTVPYHPLVNLLVWPWFAWWYLRSVGLLYNEAVRLGLFWTVVTIIVDPIAWVLLPHPWQMTLSDLYIDYQPWITLIYLVIFVSPLVVGRLMERARHNVQLNSAH